MMIAGLAKAYDQLDTHPAIKIAVQPMMDKLCLYHDAALFPNASGYAGTTLFSFTIQTNQEVKAPLKAIPGH
ncbi:hypothetical protein CROQUDRAFT_659054 [Cronartium quercuum f. sp. fusiforme G11]|uniref:Uncharacterized protein n=1 Tax=Cronartium quercuum f. sp. fusiforme G11 TaxID=708437 RepID=A0A9P6TAY6_9BASI|nr:hypothetical protein CROQUDRAFT_659054 [Cronartium quercuum f. sp. fusiforme G11]